jgi:site-specific recombinase XerD
MSQLKLQATIDQTTKNINKYIRRVAKEAGVIKDVTTYTARHSFATVLKRAGVSTEFISESIGHSDLRTTENYLDSFEDDSKIENAKKLLAFKSK